jgi:hypothetical protein
MNTARSDAQIVTLVGVPLRLGRLVHAALTWFSRSGRPINEVKRIASVSGNVITFTTPLHIDYPTTKASQVTRYQDVHVQNAGVESLKMIRGSDGAMRFEVAAYCWIKNVEITI